MFDLSITICWIIYRLFGNPFNTILFWIFFSLRVLKLTNFARQMISRIVKVFIAVIFVLIGYTLIADFFVELFGITIQIIADLFTIVGLNIFIFSIEQIPDLREMD